MVIISSKKAETIKNTQKSKKNIKSNKILYCNIIIAHIYKML